VSPGEAQKTLFRVVVGDVARIETEERDPGYGPLVRLDP
jgi:hypothetical protein